MIVIDDCQWDSLLYTASNTTGGVDYSMIVIDEANEALYYILHQMGSLLYTASNVVLYYILHQMGIFIIYCIKYVS